MAEFNLDFAEKMVMAAEAVLSEEPVTTDAVQAVTYLSLLARAAGPGR